MQRHNSWQLLASAPGLRPSFATVSFKLAKAGKLSIYSLIHDVVDLSHPSTRSSLASSALAAFDRASCKCTKEVWDCLIDGASTESNTHEQGATNKIRNVKRSAPSNPNNCIFVILGSRGVIVVVVALITCKDKQPATMTLQTAQVPSDWLRQAI